MVSFKQMQICVSTSPCVSLLWVRFTLSLLPLPTTLPGLNTGRCISFLSDKQLVFFFGGGLVNAKQLHVTASVSY